MSLPNRFRSYRWYIIARIVFPLALVILALVVAGGILYQQVITTLVIDRHEQLASLMAVSVSQVLESYADVLEALGSQSNPGFMEEGDLDMLLVQSTDALEVFNGGVILVDSDGNVIADSTNSVIDYGASADELEIYNTLQEDLAPVYGDLQNIEDNGKEFFIVAVPLFDEQEVFSGALLGILDLRTAAFGEPLRQLTADDERRAYLVDREGRIIFHPEEEEIGRDLGSQPFVDEMSAGQSGGLLRRGQSGERLVEGFAPIPGTNWGLIVQESWASVANPLQIFDAIIIFTGAVVTFAFVVLARRSVDQVIRPIQMLAKESARLAREEQIEPPAERLHVSIQEIDALEDAFYRMARKINAYRSGLHRYVRALTKSQEDERRRIARELHDETVQSLLALARHIELYQSETKDPAQLERLENLRGLVDDTLTGVRQINRDLRPLMLEDLGLVPALQTLVREACQGVSPVEEADFETNGKVIELSTEQELALYRITQEALANVRKHSEATAVKVDLKFDTDEVELIISDNGMGFEVPQAMTDFARRGNYGLLGIQERVLAVGGTVEILSSSGYGTQINVSIPLQVSA